MKVVETGDIKETLMEVIEKLTVAGFALEVLEGALFAAGDIHDKDFNRPCAATDEMIGKMVEECANRVSNIYEDVAV